MTLYLPFSGGIICLFHSSERNIVICESETHNWFYQPGQLGEFSAIEVNWKLPLWVLNQRLAWSLFLPSVAYYYYYYFLFFKQSASYTKKSLSSVKYKK